MGTRRREPQCLAIEAKPLAVVKFQSCSAHSNQLEREFHLAAASALRSKDVVRPRKCNDERRGLKAGLDLHLEELAEDL